MANTVMVFCRQGHLVHKEFKDSYDEALLWLERVRMDPELELEGCPCGAWFGRDLVVDDIVGDERFRATPTGTFLASLDWYLHPVQVPGKWLDAVDASGQPIEAYERAERYVIRILAMALPEEEEVSYDMCD